MIDTTRVRNSLPLELRWHTTDQTLPIRLLQRPPHARAHAVGLDAPPWVSTGRTDRPFDFCGHVRRLCGDIVQRCPELRRIDVNRLLFCVTQARTDRRFGLQARVTPLRFPDGDLVRRRRGTPYQVQRFFVDQVEMLYLVTFCLPRFLDQSFDDKFITLFHELYHISPAFNGDLRRHGGRYDLHSHSKHAYDRLMAQFAREYLNAGPDRALHGFLRLNFAQLEYRHGGVAGVVVPRPRLIPVGKTESHRPSPRPELLAINKKSKRGEK